MNLAMKRLRRTGVAVAFLAAAMLTAPIVAFPGPAAAQTDTATPGAPQATPADKASPKDAAQPKPTPAPASPPTPAPAPNPPTPAPDKAAPKTPTPGGQSPSPAGALKAPDAKMPPATPEGIPLAPGGKKQQNEIEPNASPTTPENATTENVDVPARPIIAVTGQSSYDDAFKSIKASLDTVKSAMEKAGLKPTGHPITIFSAPNDKGFKYQAGVPVAQKPGTGDLGNGVAAGTSPAGKAIKFQHRGAYDDIDSTYDVITAFLDAKGLQVDSPYIEEYLTDLTTPDDPNLQVDIYVFVK